MATTTKKETDKTPEPLIILRSEREKYEAKVREQTDALLVSFQKTLEVANEIYKGLVEDCKTPPDKIFATPGVEEFLNHFAPSSSGGKSSAGGKRVKSSDLKAAVLEAVKNQALTHLQIRQVPAIVKLYLDVGKSVPQIPVFLDKLIEEGVLEAKGERKSKVYKAK